MANAWVGCGNKKKRDHAVYFYGVKPTPIESDSPMSTLLHVSCPFRNGWQEIPCETFSTSTKPSPLWSSSPSSVVVLDSWASLFEPKLSLIYMSFDAEIPPHWTVGDSTPEKAESSLTFQGSPLSLLSLDQFIPNVYYVWGIMGTINFYWRRWDRSLIKKWF